MTIPHRLARKNPASCATLMCCLNNFQIISVFVLIPYKLSTLSYSSGRCLPMDVTITPAP